MNEIILIRGTRHVVTDCITCGVIYTVPERVWDAQRKSGGFHHCISGHSQGWNKENTEDEKIRRERDRLKQQLAQRDDQIEFEKRRTAAAKGEITKLKNRSKAGVCPCCNRTFKQLAAHMKNKHPDFGETVSTRLAEVG